MAGHRSQLPDGRWKIVVETGIDPSTGKRRRHSRIVGKFNDAGKELHRLEENAIQGVLAHPSKTTLAEYLRPWFEYRARRRVRAKTAERYLGIIEQHIIPTIGGLTIAQIAPMDIQKALAGWQDAGLSPATVRQHHAVLRSALGDAVSDGLISRNPASAARAPAPVHREMLAWEPEQCRAVLEALSASVLHLPVLTALSTGMRRGEVCAVRRSDVDLKDSRLRVVRTLTQTSDGLSFCDPKTTAGKRSIPMPPALVCEFKSQFKMQAQNKLVMRGAYSDGGLVFCQADGTPYRPDTLSSTFANWIKRNGPRLGVPVIGFHGLRHTYATILIAAGVDPKTIAQLMGHANVGFTLSTYGHVMRGSEEAAAEAVSQAIGS